MSLTNWLGWLMIALGAVGMFYSSSRAIGWRTTVVVWVTCTAAVGFIFLATWLITR